MAPQLQVSRGYQPEARAETMRYVFYGFQMTGLLGAVVMLFTAAVWRKIVPRHPSWFNFMITWIISCSSYIFLVGVPSGKNPSHALCLAQAALVYSVPSLTAGATISLVIHVYMTLRSMLSGVLYRTWWTIALVIGPYVPAWVVLMVSLHIGLREPDSVRRSAENMYCNLKPNLPERLSAALVAAIMLIGLAVELIIFRNLWRAWGTLKRDDRNSASRVVRVLAFTIVGMLTIILSLIFCALPKHGAAFDLTISILPLSSVLIFGTQKDIITAWGSICRRRTHGEDTWETFTPVGTRLTVTEE